MPADFKRASRILDFRLKHSEVTMYFWDGFSVIWPLTFQSEMTFHPDVQREPRTFPWKCLVRSSSCSDVVYRNVSRCSPGHSSRYAQNLSYSTTGRPKLCCSGVQPDRDFSFNQVREIDCSEPGQTGSKFIPSGILDGTEKGYSSTRSASPWALTFEFAWFLSAVPPFMYKGRWLRRFLSVTEGSLCA